MKTRCCVLLLMVACTQRPSGPHRAAVPPVLTVEAQTGLVAPHKCLCASPESIPAPSRFESECHEQFAQCGRVHYPDYLARSPETPEIDRVGKLLRTHYVESMIYDATISFAAPATQAFVAHDSTMRVHIGDVIPTPRGRARVIQVKRSFAERWDDGEVTLHYLERFPKEHTQWVNVSSGAPSHIDDVAITMMSAEGGKAAVVMVDGAITKTLELSKGDRLATSKGTFRVVDVVDGIVDDTLGWVTIDCSKS